MHSHYKQFQTFNESFSALAKQIKTSQENYEKKVN